MKPARLLALPITTASLLLCAPLASASPTTDPPLTPDYTANVVCLQNPGAPVPISRQDILTRAQSWLNLVDYSQEACYQNEFGDYRTDCSGYVAMAWGLPGAGSDYYTGNITEQATAIDKAALVEGDALWYRDEAAGEGHIALFIRWADAEMTQPVVWQEGQPGEKAEETTWSADYAAGFSAWRYNGVAA